MMTTIIAVYCFLTLKNGIINIFNLFKNLSFDISILKGLYYYFISGLMVYVYMQSDILILANISGAVEVSRYAAVTVIIFAAYLIPMSVYNYYMPKITSAYEDKNVLKKYYSQFKKLIVAVMLPIASFLFIFSKDIIYAIYGARYIDSTNIFRILSIVLFFHSLCFLYGSIITASGNQKVRSKLQTLAAFLNIVLNILVIPLYGAEGAAITTAVSEAILFSSYYYYSKILKIF
jgi:O-antigen/teichoic acid export membrane protein